LLNLVKDDGKNDLRNSTDDTGKWKKAA